jgi:hypothetical protein
MENLNEEEKFPIVIDLTNGDKLDESWLRMLGFGIQSILGAMFGGSSVPVSVKGNRGDIKAFTKALGKEKRYMDSLKKFGLDNPKTFKNKSQLERATTAFTRKTGLKWPFK